MRPLFALPMLLLLAGCLEDPFAENPPLRISDATHAADICDAAGEDSDACVDARIQAVSRCYRTIGTVNCYVVPNPFGTDGNPRAQTSTADRRLIPVARPAVPEEGEPEV